MVILQMIFLILCGSSFFAVVFNRKIEETIIFDIMSSIILVYIFGILGHLVWGVYVFIILSIILLIAEILIFIRSKNKKQIIKNIFTPGLLIFFILNVIIIYFQKGRMFSVWDEFSHWGSAVKSMFMINDFSTNPNSTLEFQSYPPAMTIFQYMFMFIKGELIEYYAYYSYDLFCISLFLPFLSNIKWKESLKIISYLILIVVIPTFFNETFYQSIYIDTALGLTFGFLVAFVIKQKEKYGIYEIAILSISMSILVLQKDTGMFLAIIAFLIFTIDALLFKNKIKIKRENIKIILKKTIMIITPLLCFFIIRMLWNYSIEINNAVIKFSGEYDIRQLIRIILGKDDTYRTTVMSNFINGCFTINIFKNIISLNTIQLGIVLSIIFIVLSKILKFEKRENSHIIIFIFGFIVYLFGLMITYMFKFHPDEAINLASFDRYINIYLSSLMFVITTLFMYHMKDCKKIICVFTLIVILLSPLQTIKQTHKTIQNTINSRMTFKEETEKIKEKVTEKNSLFFIDKRSTNSGYTYWVSRYLFIPTKFNGSIEEFNNEIFEKYDYVYIKSFDEEFAQKFSSWFDNLEENSLYKTEGNKLLKVN